MTDGRPPGSMALTGRFRPRLVLLVILAIGAGCTGLLGGDGGSLSFTAEPVSIADAAVAESGFSVAADRSFSFERSFEVAGQSPSVEVNADMIHLQRSAAAATPAHVVVVAAPDISVLGQQISLADRLGPMALIDRAGASLGELERGQKIGERQVEALGGTHTVEVYSGTAVQAGETAEVRILVATIPHGDDTVIVLGVTPEGTAGGEDRVLRAIEGLHHG